MNLKHILPSMAIMASVVSLYMPALHAQTSASQPEQIHRKTPAYYIAEFELTNPEEIKPYREQVDATFKPFSGRYIVRAAGVSRLEGNPPSHRLIIIEFDSIEQARAWYNSPEYAKIRPFRQRSGHTNAYIVEGEPE
ncbi:DUF1330 domain-containing protein [Burkholderia sp. Bp8990]|uniref:DUF1330 domain-containing protein n=1 Tax=Burkholderia sp. Bp8990 TaxID=2184552 RepID=UPI000F5B5974|nr:DUF1330 domain-containing protein [Burkholderia sp. Bp8990]RQS40904.1 DUF1330 domain-containing protein [Burkholderia sp. Bp8990]